jgi:hypothetical protein
MVAVNLRHPIHETAMRNTIRALAAIIALSPPLAMAQSFPQTLPPNTVVGRLNISSGPAQAIPISKLLQNVIAPNSIPNSALAQMPAATFKCNPSATMANAQDCTIQGLPFSASPDTNNDRVLVYNAGTGILYTTSPGNLAAGGTAGVTSLGGLTSVIGLANGLKVTGSNLDLNLGNGLCISGTSVTGCLGDGLTYVSNNITWTASTAKYTNSATGAVQQTMQQRLDSGIVYSSDFNTKCDGTTVDATAMDNFLAAVATSKSKIGIVTGTSASSVCNMGSSQFLIRPGTTIKCSRGVTLKFNLGNSLVTPFGAHSGRTYQGVFEGCNIDGQAVVGSTGIDLYDASDWVVRDTVIGNVDTGLALQGSVASYYNRILNVVAHDIRVNGYYLDPNANSNTLTGVRTTSVGQYGIYCRGNQNTFTGVQVETGFSEAFTTDGNCVGSTISGMRMESGGTGIHFVAGANYNSVVGAYCQSLTGTSYINSGTGNSKTGGNC